MSNNNHVIQYQPAQNYQPAPTNQYVSVFDDPTRFEYSLKMAEILSQSLFVPGSDKGESFRNNPANCLIALDLAGRLNLAPTALFPHLYVISGRPALSAQFVIALVNRSGRFSRIQWEEGEDGVVYFDNYGKQTQVPNYWARAYFTDLTTNERLESTRVDVELARRSGWLTKNESKWKTMPREMCRWRSAAWLCKNYAPELIFGLDFEDEVRDVEAATMAAPTYQPTTTRRPVALTLDATPEADPAEALEAQETDALFALIRNAKTHEELSRAAVKIGATDVPADVKARLRIAYKERAQALANEPKATQTEPEQPTVEKPKTTRKPRALKKAEPEPQPAPKREEVTADALRNAATIEELKRLFDVVMDAREEYTEEALSELVMAAGAREHELEDEAVEAAKEQKPTPRQEANYSQLFDGLQNAEDAGAFQKARDAVVDASERKLVTPTQASSLFEAAQEIGEAFN